MSMPTSPDVATDRREARAVSVVALAVIAFVVWRATMGINLHDGTQYLVAPLRLAQGARLFADEMPIQTLGYLVTVPLMMVWTALFGLSGISLATALYYVTIASVVGFFAYRLLRPTFRPAVAALAVGLPILATPYHLFLPSYNTVGELAFTLAACLAFAAIRDDSRPKAAGVGVALALGTFSYPSLGIAAVALLAVFAVLARGNPRLPLCALLAGVITAALCAAAIFSAVTIPELRAALAYDTANVSRANAPLAKMGYYVYRIGGALLSPSLLPMWILALVASVPALSSRARSAALAALPLAAAVPGAILVAKGDGYTFGALATTWSITFAAGAVVPVTLWSMRRARTAVLRLMALTAPCAAVGFLSIAYSTGSSWNRGVAAVALAPFSIALISGWAEAVAEGGSGFLSAGSACALVAVLGLLFGTIFLDSGLLAPRVRVQSGAYAGQTTSVDNARRVQEIQTAGRRWVKPTDGVLFLGIENGYLLVGGKIHTNSVWLEPKKSDQAAVDYFSRPGVGWPNVVFVDDAPILKDGGYLEHANRDPLLARVLADYTRVGSADALSVFVRR